MHRKFFFSAAALAAILILAAPRAAHAVAAAMVQVTNTAASPAVTLDVSHQAGQIVHLFVFTNATDISDAMSVVDGYGNISSYTPSHQTLVINTVEITPDCGSTLSLGMGSQQGFVLVDWNVSGHLTMHYTYPSGILLGANTTPSLVQVPNGNCTARVDMYGYYTAN